MNEIRILYFLFLVISLIVTFYDIIFVSHEGYNNLFILPLIFTFIMVIRNLFTPKGIVINIIDVIYFMKFVVLSFMVVYSGWYEGRAVFPPQINSFNKAIIFMTLEFLCINILYFLILSKIDVNIKKNNLGLRTIDVKKDIVYKSYIFISLIFLVFTYHSISFLGINNSEHIIESNQLTIFFNICLYISKYLIIGYIIRFYFIKYTYNPKKIYITFTVIFVLIICSIFIGDNRMDAVLPLLSIFILLNYLYKKRMIVYNAIFPLFMVLAVYLISLRRETFTYQITENKSALITDYLQIYMTGVYNTAISLELRNDYSNSFIGFFYDLIRPFLGLNFLWRSENIKTSTELFNFKIFGTENQVSQIIPLIGQFNLPFGIFGIPIYVFIITLFIYSFLRILKGIYIIEAMIVLPLIVRLCITYFQNISIFINELSSIVIIFCVLKLVIIFIKKDSISKERNSFK
ncbi:O-antigen polymerase [Mammaliicoccus sciuri]|uniref:O-antigen polymerase n=1 Tax=Mammaliicoccus sciuri TaxID=1296 RepID=UPI0019502B69|nr:O-antigen polymerase [Mammaliicoccus sciuri]